MSVKILHYNSRNLIIIIKKKLMFLTRIYFILVIINSGVNWQQVVFQTLILLLKEKVLLVCLLRSFLNRLELLHFLVVLICLNTLKVMLVALIRLRYKLVLVWFVVSVFIEIRIYIQLVSILLHLLLLSWLLLLLQLTS